MPDQKDEGLVSSTDSPELMEPEEMSHSERNNWLLHGAIPEKHDVTPKSSAAANGSQSVKPAPDSQPVKKQEQPKRAPNNAELRVRELAHERTEERKRLEARIKELEAQLKPAENGVTQASPAAQPRPIENGVRQDSPAVQSDDPRPIPDKKPDGSPWKSYMEYNDADHEWWGREYDRRREQRLQQQAAQQSQQQLMSNWNERLRKTAEKHPDYVQIAPRAPVNEALLGYLFRSASGPEILYELGSMDPQQMKEFQGLDDYGKFQRVVEMELERRPSKTRASDPAVPQVKQTRTPPPSADIGARNSAPSDEGMAAVQSDDFRAFYNHEVRKDIASRR